MKLPTLFALVALGSPLCAQPNTVTDPPCNQHWCIEEPFNYQFCDVRTGNRVDKCSTDPNNEPFLRPMKRSIPLRLCPDFSGAQYNKVSFYPDANPIGDPPVDVFVNDHMIDRMNEAADAWNKLCPQQGPNDEYDGECCLSVRWTRANSEMGNYLEEGAANTHIHKYYGDPLAGNCRTDCSQSFIVVNQQLAHTKLDERGRPIFFIATEPYPLAALPSGQGYLYVHAYSMFLHELGHWLGFNHPTQPTIDEVGCNYNSIMDVSGYPGSFTLARPDLTTEDVCMFMKLYCCESTKAGVEDPTTPSIAFAIVPNPARSYLTLRLPDDFPAAATLTLRIVDATGSTLQTTHLDEHANEIPVDLSGIPNGVYMLTLSNGSRTHGEKIIVQR